MTDRPLPETIPPGEYVLAKDHRHDRLVLVVYPDHQRRCERFAGVRIGSGGTMSVGVYVDEVMARHLLAMPGRPHDDRLDGAGCGGGSDAEHCSCWLNEEKPCCRCRYDGDEAITCVSAPDPTRAHWTEAQRQPGEKRGMRRPDKDGGGRYLDHAALSDHLVTLAEKPGDLIDAQPIAPDGTVPVERES